MVTDEQIKTAIYGADGCITAAARALGVTRQTVYNRMKKSSMIQEAKDDADESMKDIAESELVKLIRAGNLGAICFFLKCRAKERGYIERIDANISGELNVNVTAEELDEEETRLGLDRPRFALPSSNGNGNGHAHN